MYTREITNDCDPSEGSGQRELVQERSRKLSYREGRPTTADDISLIGIDIPKSSAMASWEVLLLRVNCVLNDVLGLSC